MEGSTGYYSGASHPPSLYDTSVSSASASRRNTASARSSYRESEEPQFMLSNQYSNHHNDLQTRYPMYHTSPQSIDNFNYKYNRDITAMSDPGGSRLDEHYGQYRSQRMEYARSEIDFPSSSYYESQQRSRNQAHNLQEERYGEVRAQYSQNRYSPTPPRRKSLSPPLEQQRRETHSLLQQFHSRDEEITARDSISRAYDGYHDGMHKASPSYNGRSLDPSSAVNVNELKRQLWNKNEVLKVQESSEPRRNRRIQQSLSPERQHRRHGSTPSSNNLPRFARSLSPRRRQYQSPSQIVDESPSQIRKASSTMSDTSYNSRFNSKFVEAALMAQKRTDGSYESMEDNEVGYSQNHHIQQYQQQPENRRQSFSSRPLNEGNSNKHQDIGTNKYRPASPQMNYNSNSDRSGDTRKNAADYYRSNDAHSNMKNGRGRGEARRPPIIPPSPTPLSERQERQHRGRSIDSPRFRRSDGSARRIRPPSPNLLDRIRSFDQDYHHNSYNSISERRDHGQQSVADQRVLEDSWRGMNDRNKLNISNDSAKSGRSHYNTNHEKSKMQYDRRFSNDRNYFDVGKGHASEFSTSVANRVNAHIGSHSRYQENQAERPHDSSSDIGNDRMASLVDKLSAVNRANPKNALAEIDSILREESRSSHSHSFGNRSDGDNKETKMQSYADRQTDSHIVHREVEDNNRGDGDDDDESSDVSSITNPTFQPGTQKSAFTKQMDSLYIRENDHYIMHNSMQNNNLTSFNPSTSSFRRPRPSHLRNYSNDKSKDPNTMSRSEWKRQQLEKFPPPSTINVMDEQTKNEGQRQSSADVREMMLQKNMQIDASRPRKTSKGSPRKEENSTIAKSNPKKKLGDKIVGDQKALAHKIRGWDGLSNQPSKSPSEREGKKEIRKSIGAFTKPHPWDGTRDVVETKDTSMDDAMGIEVEISTRAHHSYVRELDVDAEISVEGSGAANKVQGNHFEKARRNIKNRRDHNAFNDSSIESNDKHVLSKGHFPDMLDSDRGDSVDVPNIELSMKGVPQFNPSHQQSIVRTERGRDKKYLGGEGDSWVEMPPSSYFPDVNDNFDPNGGKSSRKSSVASKPFNATGGQLNLQSVEGLSGSRSIGRLSCKTVVPKEPKAKEKKRGFLRAFMEKKKAKAAGLGYTASASAGSISAYSTSIESRGVKSTSHIPSSTRLDSMTETMPATNFHVFAAPPGVLEAGKNARGRPGHRSGPGHRSASAPRHRSKSSEKFRSNSMAQKFNRVMQLYDSDET